MNNGKYTRKRRLRWRKEFVLLCSIAILLIGMVGGSLAYLFMGTDAVTNTFTAPDIGVTIPEDFKNGDTEKKDVKVTNSCDFEVYVRASYVAYFVAVDDDGNIIKDANGNTIVHPSTPSLNININTNDWVPSGNNDGYYVYKTTVAAGATTNNFINSASLAGTAPDGYTLVIDVIGEVVQANPAEAKTQVWGY